jgi:hypothetical protein
MALADVVTAVWSTVGCYDSSGSFHRYLRLCETLARQCSLRERIGRVVNLEHLLLRSQRSFVGRSVRKRKSHCYRLLQHVDPRHRICIRRPSNYCPYIDTLEPVVEITQQARGLRQEQPGGG